MRTAASNARSTISIQQSEERSDPERAKSRIEMTHYIKEGAAFLSTCAWFFRVWTFQEIVQAKSALVLCDNWLVDWVDLVEKTYRYAKVVRLKADVNWLRKKSTEGEDVTIQYLLKMTASRIASDPRDNLFEIMGLVGNRSSGVKVDYRKTDLEVRALVSEVFTRHGENLHILFRQLRYYDETEPVLLDDVRRASTWIPKWSTSAVPASARNNVRQNHVTMFDPKLTVKGTRLVVGGGVLGIALIEYEMLYGKPHSRWVRNGMQFPLCIYMNSVYSTEEPLRVSPATICRALHCHEQRVWSCFARSTSYVTNQQPGSRQQSDTLPPDTVKVGWLCEVFQPREFDAYRRLVLWPMWEESTHSVVFAVLSELSEIAVPGVQSFGPRAKRFCASASFVLTTLTLLGDADGFKPPDLDDTYEACYMATSDSKTGVHESCQEEHVETLIFPIDG